MADKTIAEIEAAVGSALAEDVEATIGESVTVLDHVTVAHVMLADGSTRTVWTATDGMPGYAVLGLTDWLYMEARAHR